MFHPLMAAGDGGCLCMAFGLLMIAVCLGVGAFRLWLMLNRPTVYLDMVRREHEQKMAQLEQRRQRHATARQVGGVAVVLARIFFGR